MSFPLRVSNYNRDNKEVTNLKELLEHLCCTDKASLPRQILAARTTPRHEKIHPEIFLTRETLHLLTLWKRFKRYGMQFLYPTFEVPAGVMRAFDIIEDASDRIQAQKFKSITPPPKKPKR